MVNVIVKIRIVESSELTAIDFMLQMYKSYYYILYIKMVKVMSISPLKCIDLDCINFLIAASNVFSCIEVACGFSSVTNAPSYDCFTRLLRKQHSNLEPLWAEITKFVTPKGDYLIIDDTTLG